MIFLLLQVSDLNAIFERNTESMVVNGHVQQHNSLYNLLLYMHILRQSVRIYPFYTLPCCQHVIPRNCIYKESFFLLPMVSILFHCLGIWSMGEIYSGWVNTCSKASWRIFGKLLPDNTFRHRKISDSS